MGDQQPNAAPQQQADDETKKQIEAMRTEITKLGLEKDFILAKKSITDAQFEAWKARNLGNIPIGPYKGDISMNDKIGQLESALLAVHAINEASVKAATNIKDHLKDGDRLYIHAEGSLPTFQNLIAFRIQTETIKNTLDVAIKFSEGAINFSKKEKADEMVERMMPIMPITEVSGLVLDAFSKLSGFFRSDYSVGGIVVSVNNSILIKTIASQLSFQVPHVEIFTPTIYDPESLGHTNASETLNNIWNKYRDASSRVFLHQNKTDDTNKKAIEYLNSSVTLFEKFINKLLVSDSNNEAVFLANVVKEESIAEHLSKDDSFVLLVNIDASGGAYYTKKNLWTFFGGMPLWHMGGAVISYMLIKGKTGTIISSQAIPIHGGFVRAGKLREELKK